VFKADQTIDPERVEFEAHALFDPFRVGYSLPANPWALPTAIKFDRFAVVNTNGRCC
jgi:hypothetical protein